MVAVANASGIFHSFGYNFDDPNGHIQELSDDTKEHLERMPPFVSEWQAQDIANDDFDGYFQNPMQSVTMNIKDSANTIYMSSTNVANLTSLRTAAEGLEANAYLFLTHTNKQSGVIEFDGSDSLTPYLNQAIGAGRTALYITNQTDEIQNTSPIMGNFTSLLIEPQMAANSEILTTYKQQVQNSITIISPSSSTTNLTSTQITTITNHINKINDFMNLRRIADIDFYANLRYFIDAYNKTKRLNNVGETEKYLSNNLIGTDKSKSRIA
jgi:hypothetical protein